MLTSNKALNCCQITLSNVLFFFFKGHKHNAECEHKHQFLHVVLLITVAEAVIPGQARASGNYSEQLYFL